MLSLSPGISNIINLCYLSSLDLCEILFNGEANGLHFGDLPFKMS